MYIDKTELEKLESFENVIDSAWNMVSDMNIGSFKSSIIGHDVNGEISNIETCLKSAAQKIRKLRLAYENELKK